MTIRLGLRRVAVFTVLALSGCPEDTTPADTESGEASTGGTEGSDGPTTTQTTQTTQTSMTSMTSADSTGEPPGDTGSGTDPTGETTGPINSVCGDGVVEGLEECDGVELDGQNCMGLGFQGGDLACNEDCLFEISGCFNGSCGNGLIEGGEDCDGAELGGADCLSEGFDAGTIGCAANCAFDTTACVTFMCGNGVVEGTELCDGADLGGDSCIDEGFDGGQLGCDATCAIDTSPCFTNTNCCTINGVPGCADAGIQACVCALDGFCCANSWDGICVEEAVNDCGAQCNVCGNGLVERSDVCDGNDFAGETCQTQGFDSGELGCSANCQTIQTNGCGNCGDGMLNGGENCDGALLGGASCGSFGFDGGALACNGSCDFDTSSCFNETDCCFANGTPGCEDPVVQACVCALDSFCCTTSWDSQCAGEAVNDCGALCDDCGNGAIDAGEVCDGGNLNGQTCASQGFDGGSLFCNANCDGFVTSSCSDCGNGVIETGEQCDGGNLGGQTCVGLPGFIGGNLSCNGSCQLNTNNCTPVASWSSQIMPVWNANCSCHAPAAQGGFVTPVFSGVTANTARNNLVNVASGQVPALDFIEPGSSANSYLMHKLDNTQSVGVSMPFGAAQLPAATRNMIRNWIDDGAPNN